MELNNEKYTIEDIQNNINEWVIENFKLNFEFRQYQLESITYIIKSILMDNRQNLLIEAPTGSGKTLICIIAAGVLYKYYKKTSYILCSDLFLLNQYMKAIDTLQLNDFGYLKGLSNYKCMLNGQDVKNGKCKLDKVSYCNLKNPQWRKQHYYNCVSKCEYMQDKMKAEKAKVTLMTYQLWLYYMNLVNKKERRDPGEALTFPERDIIFCDECHNIPDIIQGFCNPIIKNTNDIDNYIELLDYISAQNYSYPDNVIDDLISEEKYDSVLDNKISMNYNSLYDNDNIKKELYNIYDCLTYINDSDSPNIYDILDNYRFYFSLASNYIQYIEDDIKNSMGTNGKLNPEMSRVNHLLKWYISYIEYLNDFMKAISRCGKDSLIMQKTTVEDLLEKSTDTYSFSCAKEDYLCYNYLLKNAKYRVMMSATIGLHESFNKNIGIQYTEQQSSVLSRIPSTFNFDKSPIYYISKYKLTNSTKKYNFPIIQQLCYKIINAYKCRGLVHTGSYQNAMDLYNNAPDEIKKRMILYNGAKQKEEQMQKYIYYDDSILVGPTLVEGIDLPDDLCRINIILKVPYPNLGSNLIKKKIELFPLWYDSTTSNDIIQSIGRGVRNANDYCTTFILDGCFSWLYQKTKEQYPLDFAKRLIYLNS